MRTQSCVSEVLCDVNTNRNNLPTVEAETRRVCAKTARIVALAVAFVASMLLTGCEYAIPMHISRNAGKIQATLNSETASAILQKYLTANDERSGLIGFDYQSVGNGWLWAASGMPTLLTVTDGIVRFEAGSRKDFQKIKRTGKNRTLFKNATPLWFVNSNFEISLTTVRGVVFWDPVHAVPNRSRARIVDLQWSDCEDAVVRPPSCATSGTLSLYLREGNNDEFIAALRYFAPSATFTAAR